MIFQLAPFQCSMSVCSALLVPTEILAEQHFATLGALVRFVAQQAPPA